MLYILSGDRRVFRKIVLRRRMQIPEGDGDEARYGSFDQTGVTAKTADGRKKKKASGADEPKESDETDDEESAGGDEE